MENTGMLIDSFPKVSNSSYSPSGFLIILVLLFHILMEKLVRCYSFYYICRKFYGHKIYDDKITEL